MTHYYCLESDQLHEITGLSQFRLNSNPEAIIRKNFVQHEVHVPMLQGYLAAKGKHRSEPECLLLPQEYILGECMALLASGSDPTA